MAVAAAALLVAGIVSGAPAAAASTPSETVIPAALRYRPRADMVYFAGPGGFLHRQEQQPSAVWTKYSGGPDIPVSISRYASMGTAGAGADVVADYSGSTVLLQDMDTGTTSTITLPSGQSYIGTFGSRVLTDEGPSTGPLSLHLLAISGGQQTDTPVTGLSGVTNVNVLAGDADSVLLRYTDSSGTRLAVLDLATGQATPVFGAIPSPGYVGGLLDGGYVGWYTQIAGQPATLHLLPRSDLSATETTVQIPLPQLPSGDTAGGVRLAIVGQTLLADFAVSQSGPLVNTNLLGFPLYSMPLSGGSLTPIIQHTVQPLLQSAPNGAVIPGGTSITDWAARRITTDSTGALTVTPVDSDPPVTSPLGGLAMAGGQLLTAEDGTQVDADAFTRTVQLSSTGAPAYGPHTAVGNTPVFSNCDTASSCAPPIYTEHGQIAQLNASSSGDVVSVQQGSSDYSVKPGVGGGSLVDADGEYVVYDNPSTNTQYIGDTALANSSNILFTRPLTGAGLSGSTLWAADATTPGQISAIDLPTRHTMQSVETGAACTPTEVQAAADRWIYWTCGTTGPAGVVDAATGAQMTVPAGIAQIGDGYVVTHDTTAGKLVLTDVHTDTAVTSDLAALPADTVVPDDRRVTWAVDKYNGGIAYTDAQNNIHLLDPHLPATAPIANANTSLLPGQRLMPGAGITSGSMRLVMQTDGNLVAYLTAGGGSTPEWASNTWGNPGAYALLQPDGNLVVYRKNGGPATGGALWSTGTWGTPGAYALLQDDGNLVVYRPGTTDPADALWSTGTNAHPQTITPGTTLHSGWWTQGRYTTLVMQPDGNLVIYRKRDGAAIWSTGTWGHPGAYAVMQKDGNLVVYRPGGGALWSTGTWNHPGAYAIMQDDGNLVVYRPGTTDPSGALWSTGTWQTAQ